MHLHSYSVSGFRSLAEVAEIPVSTPTILAGPNDGGKSAALDAIRFLLDSHKLIDDDRTFLVGVAGERGPHVEVVGTFSLSVWEQDTFSLPKTVRVRRFAEAGAEPRYQIWASTPDDASLHDLDQKRVPELKQLATACGIGLAKATKPQLLAALREYASKQPSSEGWAEVPRNLLDRMPRIASFDGTTLDPEAAIRSALGLRFKSYLADDAVRGRVEELESDARGWLAIEAKPLADHIAERCPDIAVVTVEPTVTVAPALGTMSLRLERASGEPVRLDRSGLGSKRRISMAVWEANSELLKQPEAEDADEDAAPPVQTIVVYDEPDTHLDYHFQRETMRLIRKQASLPNVNVVVATHSMNLIDGVDIRDVVLMRLDEHRRTVLERLGTGTHSDFDKHLGAVAAAVGLRNSVLLHERCFLAVEGETEQQTFPLLFALCEGLSLQAAGIALWACGGNDGALHLASYLVKHNRTVVLMIDADSEKESKIFSSANLSTKFGTHKEQIVSWVGKSAKKNELEELFDDEIWALTANEAWPRKEGSWTAADFDALRDQGKFSAKVMGMLREQSETYPSGKPAMVMEITLRLTEPAEVPGDLRDAFAKLRMLANQ